MFLFITFPINIYWKNKNTISTSFALQNRVDFMQLMVDAQISEKNKEDTSSKKGRERNQMEELKFITSLLKGHFKDLKGHFVIRK